MTKRSETAATSVKTIQGKPVRRRDVLHALGVGVGATAVAASASLIEPAAAQSESDVEKRKARYQPNSADVQNYYRVNRYPTK